MDGLCARRGCRLASNPAYRPPKVPGLIILPESSYWSGADRCRRSLVARRPESPLAQIVDGSVAKS
jgi:hypothetical protein